MPEDLSTDLESLKEADPETWQEYNGDIGSVILVHSDEEEYEKYFTREDCWTQVSEAWLQGCLQRACERRKWAPIQAVHYIGVNRGLRLYAVDLRDHENFSLSKAESQTSPAHAFLRAYLAALK